MSNFETALAWIFLAEGVDSDNPRDPGARTRFGISLRYLQSKGRLGDINGDGIVDASDVQAMTRERAALYYQADFWTPCRCDELPPALAIACFDHAVNAGPPSAIRLLQRALHVPADGIIGDVTLSAAQRVAQTNTDLIPAYLGHRAQYYHDIVVANSSLAEFLRGWFNRLFLLQQHLGRL